MNPQTSAQSTIILGGGIIGLSVAYYLCLHQPSLAENGDIHIVDSAPTLLLSASGHAGGFLAKDWFSPASASLGALSFRLHKELAETHDGARNWGYAESTAYSLGIDETGVRKVSTRKRDGPEEWLSEGSSRAAVAQSTSNTTDRPVQSTATVPESEEMLYHDGTPRWITRQEGGTLEEISNRDSCAQVEPKELSQWLMSEVEKRGVQIHLSSKTVGLVHDSGGEISGVSVQRHRVKEVISGRNIVIACGAWTTRAFKTLFPDSRARVGIGPLAGYSITVRTPRYSKPILDPARHERRNGSSGSTGMCHAVFCASSSAWPFAPEAIARMTKFGRPEVYVAGLNDTNMPLPPDVTGIMEMFDPQKAKRLKETTVLLTGLSREADGFNDIEDDLEVVREALCARPVTNNGKPVVTKVDPEMLGSSGSGGVFIASGHGPWGISLSLGTGLVVAELIQGKKPSADIRSLGLT